MFCAKWCVSLHNDWQKVACVSQFISEFFEAFGFLYKAFEKIVTGQMEVWSKQVINSMPDFYRDDEYDKFQIIVSVGDYNWFKHRDVLVNASLISEKHVDTFLPNDRFLGWCFKPAGSQILGMSSGEPASTVTRFSANPKEFAEVLRGKSFLDGNTLTKAFLDLDKHCEDPQEFLQHQGVNTILLDGSAEPCGVFCRIAGDKEASAQNREKAETAAKLFNLPLVFLFEDQRKLVVKRV